MKQSHWTKWLDSCWVITPCRSQPVCPRGNSHLSSSSHTSGSFRYKLKQIAHEERNPSTYHSAQASEITRVGLDSAERGRKAVFSICDHSESQQQFWGAGIRGSSQFPIRNRRWKSCWHMVCTAPASPKQLKYSYTSLEINSTPGRDLIRIIFSLLILDKKYMERACVRAKFP